MLSLLSHLKKTGCVVIEHFSMSFRHSCTHVGKTKALRTVISCVLPHLLNITASTTLMQQGALQQPIEIVGLSKRHCHLRIRLTRSLPTTNRRRRQSQVCRRLGRVTFAISRNTNLCAATPLDARRRSKRLAALEIIHDRRVHPARNKHGRQ